MHPAMGTSWEIVRERLLRVHVDHPGNTILHDWSKPRATHRGRYNSPQELAVEIHLVVSLLYGARQEAQKLTGGLENGVSLFNGDAVGHVPWELGQGADETLIRTLGTVFGERRLGMVSNRHSRKVLDYLPGEGLLHA